MTLVVKLKDCEKKFDISKKNFEDVEKALCAAACERLQYNDDSSKVESVLADEQCKASQIDRDLQVSNHLVT